MSSHSVLIVDDGTAPPPPPVWDPPKNRINLLWDTWDDRRYNLTDYRTGVFLIGKGLEGLGYPTVENYTQTSPSVHGSAWNGWIATGRKVFWTVGVYHDGSSEAWLQRNRAFLRSMMPGTVGRWTVELPGGERRGLNLRYKGGLDAAFDVDPAYVGWQVYGIEFLVEQPFWEGEFEERNWSPGGDTLWAGPTGFGPPWYVSEAQKMSTATITNSGDVEVFPEWELTGPFTSAGFGTGSRVTPVPFEVLAGRSLIITTDPRTGLTAELNGVDVMDRIPGFASVAIPPGANTKLILSMAGTGKIIARFRPLYMAGV